VRDQVYQAPGRRNQLISVSIDTVTMTSDCGTCLIHHIDEGLHIVPKEAMDCVTLILTREYDFDQGRDLVQSECTSSQTPRGWNTEVRRVAVISTPCKICEGGAEGVPLSGAEVVVAGSTGMVSSSALGGLGLSSISWILNLCPSTFLLLCLACGAFAPLLRVRSISSVTLELPGEGAFRTRPIDAPFQILECHPHRFVEVLRIPPLEYSLQHFAYVETVFRQLHGILVVN